ncbi:phage tail protein, partial [Francisella tularensis subsp. holarctica]|nr:phage tail protein [Francisella tularensis subsp. holarctica]
LSLNSELCLNLDTVDKISKIIISYLSILNTYFTRFSPSESKQKNQLAEKGIKNFLVTMDANFAQMLNQDKLLPNNIDSI